MKYVRIVAGLTGPSERESDGLEKYRRVRSSLHPLRVFLARPVAALLESGRFSQPIVITVLCIRVIVARLSPMTTLTSPRLRRQLRITDPPRSRPYLVVLRG